MDTPSPYKSTLPNLGRALRLATGFVVAGALLATSTVHAWDRVITFDEYEIGAHRSPDDPIAELWKTTRDEGYEGGRDIGFVTHNILDNEAGGKMYSLTSDGYGFSWGHAFATVDFDQPVTEQGTWYFQTAVDGQSRDMSISTRETLTERVDPPEESNPWGWDGPRAWGDKRSTVRMAEGASGINIRDGGSFRFGQLDWVPGAWYEVWVTDDIPSQMYTVWVRSEAAGIPEITAIEVEFEEDKFTDYFFRSSADQLTGILLGTQVGNPASPQIGHRVYFNAFAFDYSEHNLTRPEGLTVPDAGVEVAIFIFGFRTVSGTTEEELRGNTFGIFGTDVWFASVPYVYDFDLGVWMWVPSLWRPAEYDDEGEMTEPGRPRTPEFNLSIETPGWVYIWDNPFPANQWTGSAEWGNWVYGTESGWVWVMNSR